GAPGWKKADAFLGSLFDLPLPGRELVESFQAHNPHVHGAEPARNRRRVDRDVSTAHDKDAPRERLPGDRDMRKDCSD
ncbi:MAG: hypothetical protein HYX75_23515, partial [Acidobacteria bacterium]|nr:hypothetical protein [Acidobacteriota bacterium]